MSRLAELVRGGGPPISRVNSRLRDTPVTVNRAMLLELEALLHLRNGFRTLEGALLIRPSITVGQVRSIEDWNQITLWRKPYSRASEILFFADTVLGFQFGLYRDEVVLFDPEEGERYTFAFSFEAWAGKVQNEIDKLGGHALKIWELEHKPLTEAERLQCRIPLRFGGSDTDVTVLKDHDLMRRMGTLYTNNLDTVSADKANLEGWWAGPEPEPEPAPVAEPDSDSDSDSESESESDSGADSVSVSDSESEAGMDADDKALLEQIARELAETEPPKAPPPPKGQLAEEAAQDLADGDGDDDDAA